jgi:hypothetical protein
MRINDISVVGEVNYNVFLLSTNNKNLTRIFFYFALFLCVLDKV